MWMRLPSACGMQTEAPSAGRELCSAARRGRSQLESVDEDREMEHVEAIATMMKAGRRSNDSDESPKGPAATARHTQGLKTSKSGKKLRRCSTDENMKLSHRKEKLRRRSSGRSPLGRQRTLSHIEGQSSQDKADGVDSGGDGERDGGEGDEDGGDRGDRDAKAEL